MSLILRTDEGDFDLFGDEQIVQTLAIFNFEDISTFNGEYTNNFELPFTNNNSKLIGHADFILNVETAPYKKLNCKLIIGGLEFKSGLLIIEEITDVIKARFISGNSNFYSLIKNVYLSNLDWDAYNHTWNYTNALASAGNTEGYVYPIITYNGQTLAGTTLDVRKILPSTFVKTILDLMFSEYDYTAVYNFDLTEIENILLPYTNKIPSYSAEYLLLNSLDASTSTQYGSTYNMSVGYSVIEGAGWKTFYIPEVYDIRNELDIFAAGSSTFWNTPNKFFTVVAPGVYTYNIFVDLATYVPTGTITVTNVNTTEVPNHYWHARYELRLIKYINGVDTIIDSKILTSSYTMSGKVQLNIGDNVFFRLVPIGYVSYQLAGGYNGGFSVSISNTVLNTNTFTLDLSPELTFGNLITYSSMLPKIKASDFLRDICIRFGLILQINDDTKTVYLNKFDEIYNNVLTAKNWSDKLDDTQPPTIKFKYDTYAQNNLFNHKEDKSILETNVNTNYNIVINNDNLILDKTFYTSVFAESENVTFGGIETTTIDLYDTTAGKFNKEVQPRILNSALGNDFRYTDGTTTSALTDARRVWFIDDTLPDDSLGYAFILPRNSNLIIETLQNLKIVKAKLNLSLDDIKNLDYFTPVYIESLQSYFFISKINQFNYTNPELTEVELIKLNP